MFHECYAYLYAYGTLDFRKIRSVDVNWLKKMDEQKWFISDHATMEDNHPLLAQFMSITGTNAETATQYLELTNWSLDESVNIFMESGGGGGGATAASSSASVDPDIVRAPDAAKRQRLVGGHPVHDLFSGSRSAGGMEASVNMNHDPFRNFAAEASSFVQATNLNSPREEGDRGDHLHSLFQPPTDLVFRGSLQDAREAAKGDTKWLLVNIQDHQQFSSHMLNRDTWSDDVVQNVVASAFVFWQVHSNTSEGKRFCALHQLGEEKLPYIGIIDPRTGQEIVQWVGFVDPQDLTMKLSDFCDQYSVESSTLPTRRGSKSKAPAETIDLSGGSSSTGAPTTFSHETHPSEAQSTSDIMNQSEDAQLAAAIAASMQEDEDTKQDDVGHCQNENQNAGTGSTEVESTIKAPTPALPEEPPADDPDVTRVQIRTPEGTKLVRRVFKHDPVALVFRVVRQEVPEARSKVFQLRMAYPPKPIEDTSETTIEEAKLTNATLVLHWV